MDAASQGSMCIKVISHDTHVFILLVHFNQNCSLNGTLLMESNSQSRALTDIGSNAKPLANTACQLLAAHALTGFGTVALVWGIGKTKTVKVLSSGSQQLKIDNPNVAMNCVLQEVTQFVARFYGCMQSESLPLARTKV